MKKAVLILTALALTAAGPAMAGYKPVSDNLPTLTIAFNGGGWDGKNVPSGQECDKDGGKGATPPLIVSGIPEGANAIIIEINDESYYELSYDGGHGKIGFWIEGGGEATLPPVPGGTTKVPAGTFIETPNRASGEWATPGYIPPCSGGAGNTYSAVVKAVFKPKEKGQQGKLLATGKFRLGDY